MLIPLSSINFAWRRLVAERLCGVDLPGRVVPVALDVREAGTVDRGRSVVTEKKEALPYADFRFRVRRPLKIFL